VKKILFIAPYPFKGASSRYRVCQYFPYLDEKGISYTFSPFFSEAFFEILYQKGHWTLKMLYFLEGTIRRLIDCIRSFRYDAVFIHLEAFPLGITFFERCLKRINGRIIYDLDDAIFMKASSEVNSFVKHFKSSLKYPKIISMSTGIITCNQYLSESYVKRYTGLPVEVIHTPIDTDRFSPAPVPISNDPVLLGWIGSPTTAVYLESIIPWLESLYGEIPFHLKIIGANRQIESNCIPIIQRNWEYETEVDEFRSLDIGLYPLPDNDWIKGKTGFKPIQYMAVGIPCVCSALGSNLTIIKDGWNGFLASNETEWKTKLGCLIRNPELCREMGRRGRECAVREYSVYANAEKFLKVIESVMS